MSNLNELYNVPFVNRPVSGSIRPPGSKSITNRALICAAAARDKSVLRNALDSEDTQVMVTALNQLGLDVRWEGPNLLVDGGVKRIKEPESEIFVANSGTTIRFLGALLAGVGGTFRLNGVARMEERPIKDLVDALRQLGVDAKCSETGCPPLWFDSHGFHHSNCKIKGDISSQYLSGLLMAAPLASNALSISVVGDLVSVPYIDITLEVMNAFGVSVRCDQYREFMIPATSTYRGTVYDIEPDASAASYFFALAAITQGEITVSGLGKNAIQGDIAFVECLEAMGCEVEYTESSITVIGKPLKGIDVDMNAISDTVPTLGVVALFANGTTNIRNVEHVRHKETDRITDLARELIKLGADVDERPDGLSITPVQMNAAEIETYNDHRMAMSFAIAGTMIDGVTIHDPACCEKTYPKFFDDLGELLEVGDG